ncbi:Integral membrane protein OS=Tsukamurella paurometabola (strain ATCC 8368 / DSM / CCUG 35730/ CIP 100753 / JCM 10117 / KCTC 9821 / NBRC 16120 / NCIMB 702349/ NCTC 13040) OX=521096 GN=Tpau_3330 PE=4 SV=1 [Tsukamurella paurometabola]|uniref:Uncharacterized protein n=1 Tax=Tsukamurella paurometabola (strain ATCC 8368 / DSM 20162 / CCUG 35730 / CIP 100753 / JCM 10117 / KCTC 9821 / NBRC 16120 / NCIMB 702349 / NCTC 13040) TaxID=521096 RepID=D5UWB5_TSUPD|nr:hypothetical protein [Tsukamurella paurometabola]ADG79914.1 conserved hypothetical protein [Tsukamurella paurometabola DSM 20162]SUP37640.1 Uncharacterised protein [Tsukamurella paurometabola]
MSRRLRLPTSPSHRLLWIGAALLVAVQLAVRGYVLARGNFYWDDVVFLSRSGRPLLDPGAWFVDYDGHLMPAALFTAAVTTTLAPLSWPAAAASLLLLQLVAALATLRALVIVAGRRPMVLVPFVFYLLAPLTLPAMAWWASGLNALPLQIGLAVVVGETVRYLRGNRRSGLWAVLALLVTLLFFEKAIAIPFVAVAAVILARYLRGHPVRSALRRGRWLWLAFGVIVVGWFTLWSVLTASRPGEHTVSFTSYALYRSVESVLAPAALGGPWSWTRENPGPPVAVPNVVVTVIGLLAIAVILAVTWRRAPRGLAAWGAAAAYFVASLAPVFFLRSSEFTSALLPLSLRYFADFAWVLTLAGALVLIARRRRRGIDPRAWVAVVLAFAVSASVATVRFATVWSDNPTGSYLAQLRDGARVYADRPVLDQEISTEVIARLAYPDNTLSHVLATLPEKPRFGTSSAEATVVDKQGRFVPGRVSRVRSVPVGDLPGCGTRVDGTQTLLRYEGPLAYWEWVVELNYLASADGVLVLQQERAGTSVRVPVQRGPHTVYVRVPGAGGGLQARAESPGLFACVTGGPVGLLIPASFPER